MSSTSGTTVTDNSILAWNEMESLDHAYQQALTKGDVMNAMRNVLAILTLLNGVSTTRETEDANDRTRNVELLQQIQAILEEGLTSAELTEKIAREIAALQGKDFLNQYASLDAILAAATGGLSDEELFKYISREQFTLLLQAALDAGEGLDLESFFNTAIPENQVQAFKAALVGMWSEGVVERSNYSSTSGGQFDYVVKNQRMNELAEAYESASTSEERKDILEQAANVLTKLGVYIGSSNEEKADAAEEYLDRIVSWQNAVDSISESSDLSPMELDFFEALSIQGDFRLPYEITYNTGEELTVGSYILSFADSSVNAARDATLATLTGLMSSALGFEFDPKDAGDVAAALDVMKNGTGSLDDQTAADAAALDAILKRTIGLDFAGLKGALENDPANLADQIQKQIDVDTRLSDNQAITLKQLLDEQQLLLTMISEIVNLTARMNRMITQ